MAGEKVSSRAPKEGEGPAGELAAQSRSLACSAQEHVGSQNPDRQWITSQAAIESPIF